ncbi:MAG: hypothetical protein NTV80_24730 [Verrucomicrobia bacterium]|nr:hypothetical protein [Verrucomicrobiota bacterium]
MPYDPTQPLPNSPLESQVIRDQLQALFNLINNIVSVTAVQVDSTSTLPQGTPANASVSMVDSTLHFSFEIPQGQEGLVGPVGPPFAGVAVDGVNTLNPGDAATVSVNFDGSNVRFTFGIPRGNDGAQGSVGEISQAQLDSAITGTSANTNSVGTLDTGFADPDLEAVRQKVNELILNGRR